MKRQTFRYWSRYSREYLYEPRKYASLTSLIVFILLVFLFLFGFRPTLDEINSKTDQINLRAEQLNSVELYLSNVNKIRPVYEQLIPKLPALDYAIPSDNNLATFLEQISIRAATVGIELTSLTPVEKAGQVGLKEIEIQAVFVGNLQNTLNLIKELEQNQRFIGIKRVSILEAQDTSDGTVSMTLVIYYLKP